MKNRFIGLAAVSMLIPAMLLAQPAGKKQLVGVWAVKESPVEQSQSPLLSLAMFGGDGSFTTGVGYKGLPPIPVVQDVATELGPGYGRWAATERQGVPPDVLRRDAEDRRRGRIPASPSHLGFVRIGRRVHWPCPARLFGYRLERRVQHH